MNKTVHLITLIFILQWPLLFPANADEPYTWSVVPQFTGTAVHRDWTPLLQHIEETSGYRIKLKIYNTIPEFEIGFLNGAPDFAYMNPYHVVMAWRAQGYIPIVRSGRRSLTGILVTRKDSPIKDVKDLEGKTIAFPSPNAFAASLYMRALLREQHGIEFIPVYVGTHSNAYRHALTGKSSAAGAVTRTLNKEREEVRDNLKIIFKTPPNPSHPLTAHKRVPLEVRNAVQKAIISLDNSEEGKVLLKNILLSDPVKADYHGDYQPLEQLNLDKYVVSHN